MYMYFVFILFYIGTENFKKKCPSGIVHNLLKQANCVLIPYTIVHHSFKVHIVSRNTPRGTWTAHVHVYYPFCSHRFQLCLPSGELSSGDLAQDDGRPTYRPFLALQVLCSIHEAERYLRQNVYKSNYTYHVIYKQRVLLMKHGKDLQQQTTHVCSN